MRQRIHRLHHNLPVESRHRLICWRQENIFLCQFTVSLNALLCQSSKQKSFLTKCSFVWYFSSVSPVVGNFLNNSCLGSNRLETNALCMQPEYAWSVNDVRSKTELPGDQPLQLFCVRPKYTCSIHGVGASRSISFCRFFYMVSLFCFFPTIFYIVHID